MHVYATLRASSSAAATARPCCCASSARPAGLDRPQRNRQPRAESPGLAAPRADEPGRRSRRAPPRSPGHAPEDECLRHRVGAVVDVDVVVREQPGRQDPASRDGSRCEQLARASRARARDERPLDAVPVQRQVRRCWIVLSFWNVPTAQTSLAETAVDTAEEIVRAVRGARIRRRAHTPTRPVPVHGVRQCAPRAASRRPRCPSARER